MQLENITKEQIRSYFLWSYKTYEKLFDLLKNDVAFYQQPEPLRHPLIFYYGHTAVFYINKLRLAKLIDKRVNEEYESIFAIGVDEMSWDDLDSSHYDWPQVREVREYRQEVKQIVLDLIDRLSLDKPIGWESPWWIILMGIEHELIHLETSSVLFRQLDLKYLKEDDFIVPVCEEFSTTTFPKNELIKVAGGLVELGRSKENPLFYGWDNEFGSEKVLVKDFYASKYLVSNGEFLEFVENGGYEREEFWEEEGWQWRSYKDAKHPTFWRKINGEWIYRAINKELPLPLDWPVDVNYHEAKAFCNYLTQKLGKDITLSTEAKWHRLYAQSQIDDANIELRHFFSSCSIERFKHGEFYDVIGNVWQWTQTPIHPFEGFKVHPVYDDFSVPTFDNRHNIIKSGSFISCGNEANPLSRYAFRRHFFQHAGFRYIIGEEDEMQQRFYESDKEIAQYCEFHYGSEYFGVPNFPATLAKRAAKYTTNFNKALDIGCAVGRGTFELAKYFDEVWGLDFSARFIMVANELKEKGSFDYAIAIEGERVEEKSVTLESFIAPNLAQCCHFYQADACNLRPLYTGYDLVMALNLIDRLYDPKKFLEDIKERINKSGVLMIASPYTWDEAYTPKDAWLGGEKESFEVLREILEPEFELLDRFDQPFVIRETARKFQHTIADVSVWKKC
ncbi:5-histidylcysteine sulfoxide synthase [Nitratiruptor sp. YY09-18]|uniref:5-histidylcysteine sulfoxide synthase n=1 Tax=Nitratiruptor sp. YY09-18 TaxID=2724901 RepID=UPI001916B3E7|nr:5-histidylcysteine sulfoxide synthase [Nitratiruptor sp. YY09-18]BCD68492.1 hypothetical protein NitYY0918_C1407 [Nitratiruptor sp. YY09-18]